jgi:hypothetical protein
MQQPSLAFYPQKETMSLLLGHGVRALRRPSLAFLSSKAEWAAVESPKV